MPTHFSRRSLIRGITAATAVASLAAGLAACGGDSDAATTTDAVGTVTVGQLSNGAAKQAELKVSEVKSISAELPAPVRRSGTLAIGVGALPDGFPPSRSSVPTRRRSPAPSPTSGVWSPRSSA